MSQRQPNSNQCFVCGLSNPIGLQMSFYTSAPGEVTAEYTVPERYQGYPGVVHGGIVAAMLDEVCGRTLMSADPPRFLYTARLSIRYRKNVPVGEMLRLVGCAGKNKKRTATATGTIYNADGEILAEAEALLINMPDEVVSSVNLEALGWKVYDD